METCILQESGKRQHLFSDIINQLVVSPCSVYLLCEEIHPLNAFQLFASVFKVSANCDFYFFERSRGWFQGFLYLTSRENTRRNANNYSKRNYYFNLPVFPPTHTLSVYQ